MSNWHLWKNNPFADELPLRWSTSPCDFRRVTPHLRLHADAQELFQDLWSALLPLRQAHDLGETSQPNGEVLWAFTIILLKMMVRFCGPKDDQVAFFLWFIFNMLEQQNCGRFCGRFCGDFALTSPTEASPARPLCRHKSLEYSQSCLQALHCCLAA